MEEYKYIYMTLYGFLDGVLEEFIQRAKGTELDFITL